MAEQRLGQFYEGFASWRRALARAAPESQPVIFANAVAEVAGFVRAGLDRVVAADELADMAASIGFDDADRVQQIIGSTFASIDAVYDGQPTVVDWSKYGDYEDAVTLDRLDDRPQQTKIKGKTEANGRDTEQTYQPIVQQEAFIASLQPPEYLVEGLLQRRFIYSLTGKTGAGKTALTLYIALCVALGRPIGDMDTVQGNVLYLVGENPDDVGYRWRAMRQQMDVEHLPVPVWFAPKKAKLSTSFASLTEQARAVGGFALVIADTGPAYFEGKDINNNVEARDHALMLRELTKLPGGPCALVNCHPVKYANADQLLPAGAGAFLNEVDGNLTAAVEGTAITLHWLGKFRGPEFNPVSFELQSGITHPDNITSTGKLIPTVIARHLSDASREGMDKAASGDAALVLAEIKRDPRASLRDLAQRLGWTLATGKPHHSKAKRAIAKLNKAKLIAVDELGGWEVTEKGKKRLEKHPVQSGTGPSVPPDQPTFLAQ